MRLWPRIVTLVVVGELRVLVRLLKFAKNLRACGKWKPIAKKG
jgi:hypothetical protein